MKHLLTRLNLALPLVCCAPLWAQQPPDRPAQTPMGTVFEAAARAPKPPAAEQPPAEPPRQDAQAADELEIPPEGKLTRKQRKALTAALAPEYQQWLIEVELLMTRQERDTFLRLGKDYQRDAFIERFWRIRDPYPQSTRNELKEKWDVRVAQVHELTGGRFDGDRARVLLANGAPDALIEIRCADLWPGQVWYYRRAETVGNEMALLFYQLDGMSRYRLWYATDGLAALLRFRNAENPTVYEVTDSCGHEAQNALNAVLRMAYQQGELGYATLLAQAQQEPERPSGEWAETFHNYSTDLDAGVATFDAEVQLEFPGRRKSRTVVQGVVAIAVDQLEVSELAGHQAYNLILVGEVLREGKLFDSFRYNFNHPLGPADEAPPEKIPLLFERYLRPGTYELILKAQDLNGGRFFRQSGPLKVPRVENRVASRPLDPETARILAEANAAIASGDTTIKIVPPREGLQTGLHRIDTLTTGGDIARVDFTIEGQTLSKRSPPFSVELDFGDLPRMRILSAVAYDAAGEELARDEMALNAGSHRFAIRLVEPRRDKKYSRSLRAHAEVEVPEGEAVERVEFYLNEDLVASLYQEPWAHPIVLASPDEVAYVRAVAIQPDGNSTEDLVFVNAPDYLEELDVQFVELYVAVLDRQKRPVDGLQSEQFEVMEDGVPQMPVRFEKVANLPIHAGILLDVSASMADSLGVAQQAAVQFFEQTLTPKDRATLITFNDHPNLAARFTNDLAVLAGGLSGLEAERGTALYDSLIFSLYYFNGIKGQRALVVLSDGRDEHSRFDFDDALEYARRAGVAIYSIGLDRGRRLGDARQKLVRLAAETGGRSFFIKDISELAPIYDEIQHELRSRYYLAYQSTNTTADAGFRTIDVDLTRGDLEAKTLRGYYP